MTRNRITAILRIAVTAIAASFFVILTSGALPAIGQSKQLSLADILIALRSKKAVIEDKNRILTDAVKERGVTFVLTTEIEKELAVTGAYPPLIEAIRAKTTPPATMPEKPVVQIASVTPKPLGPVPDFAFYRTRAANAINTGDLDGALIELQKAIDLKPQEPSTYYERGMIYVKQEKLDAAAGQFSKALEFAPKDAASLFQRAAVLERLGQSNDALADYQRAAEIDPANEDARNAAVRIKNDQIRAAELAAIKAAPPQTQPAAPSVVPKFVSLGSLNEYATKLAMPIYSQSDRRLGIQGRVTVKVGLDAEGKVTSAEASDGPRSLRAAAEDAVRRSKFKPVTTAGQPVAASGYIVFNFVANP